MLGTHIGYYWIPATTDAIKPSTVLGPYKTASEAIMQDDGSSEVGYCVYGHLAVERVHYQTANAKFTLMPVSNVVMMKKS